MLKMNALSDCCLPFRSCPSGSCCMSLTLSEETKEWTCSASGRLLKLVLCVQKIFDGFFFLFFSQLETNAHYPDDDDVELHVLGCRLTY